MEKYLLKPKKKLRLYSSINIPWVEKYRPDTTEDIILDPFIKIKINKIENSNSIPNLIITGEPGTGKTSTIQCLAKKIYTSYYENNVLELNASDDRGLSIINNTILPFCKKKTDHMTHKLVILDEADSITSKAQNLLSNVIAGFKKNTRFIFICNDCSKITESIQSRCMIIKFPRIKSDGIKEKVKYICKKENIKYDEKGIDSLIFASTEDIRQTINNLECIHHCYEDLNEENVYKFVDLPKPVYIKSILDNCLKGEIKNCIKIIQELYNKGYSPNDILLTFMRYLLDDKFELSEETILKIYEIVSLSYIRVNNGIDTLLQLCGCISKISLYLSS